MQIKKEEACCCTPLPETIMDDLKKVFLPVVVATTVMRAVSAVTAITSVTAVSVT